MDIKLKSNLKKYISKVWLIELIVLVFICSYFGTEIFKNFSKKSYSKAIIAIEATINPSEYYKKNLKTDVYSLIQMIYNRTNSFELLSYGSSEVKDVLKKNFLYKSYENNLDTKNEDIYFIIRNKQTNEIYTNDPNEFFQIEDAEYLNDSIMKYLDEKYNSKELVLYYDNVNNFDEYVCNNDFGADKSLLADYEEYYYTDLDSYKNNTYVTKVCILLFLASITIFLGIKIIVIYFKDPNNFEIRGNFISNIIYSLRYGFKYKETRKILIISIIVFIAFFIMYLYLLAIGGYENNMLVTFFRLYPFKGSMFIIGFSMFVILYSIKKTIEIAIINEGLKKINEGNLDYHIVEKGDSEILELIENINKIKMGYEIAVEETLRNEKLKTELISNVSHDLRTPLTSIINYVNILKSSELSEEERSDYLKIVEQKSKKLKVIIDDLFEMSKINSGKMEPKKEKIDIMSLIHQAVGEYSYLYEDKNIHFKVNSLTEEIYINLDGMMMSRVIENIVINALKYSLEDTRVYIDVLDGIDSVEISCKNVANYEMDFDDDEIFERFARGDRSRNSKIEGSGLGLAIAKSIIELHNGNIKINREGDMFKIYIVLPK